jgi:uncharacterized protein (DUF1330 family)
MRRNFEHYSSKNEHMSAYIIVEIEIHDPTQYEAYKRLTPASLELFGGRFLVRGGKTETLEGDWDAKRIVVIEFDNAERAKQWYASEAYAPAKALRQKISETKMLLVEGLNQ